MADKLNLSNVQFEPIRESEVEAVFTNHTLKDASTGNKMIACEFTVTDPSTYKGRKLFRNFTFTVDSLPYMKRGVLAMGVAPEDLDQDFSDLASLASYVDDLLLPQHGNAVKLGLSIREYQGEERNEVKSIAPAAAF